MEWNQAVQQMNVDNLAPIYILVGTDTFLKEKFIERIRNHRMKSNHTDIVEVAKYQFDEEGAEGAVLACQTVSFFGNSEIILLQNCTAFLSQSKVKQDAEILESYLQKPILDRTLVITVDAEKMDERKKITKFAKQHLIVNCQPPKDEFAYTMLRTLAQERNILIDENALVELWRRCGSLQVCQAELDKVWIYSGRKNITLENVRTVVTEPLEDNVFHWLDSLVKGETQRALQMIQHLHHAGYDGFALLSMIARQLRMMWFAKTLGAEGQSAQAIASRMGAHPYAVKIAIAQSRYWTLKTLEKIILSIADTEFALKTGRRGMSHALDLIVFDCAVSVLSMEK